jgi:hypothetical protein
MFKCFTDPDILGAPASKYDKVTMKLQNISDLSIRMNCHTILVDPLNHQKYIRYQTTLCNFFTYKQVWECSYPNSGPSVMYPPKIKISTAALITLAEVMAVDMVIRQLQWAWRQRQAMIATILATSPPSNIEICLPLDKTAPSQGRQD